MRTRTIALAGLLALVAGACSLADDEPVPAPTGSAPSSVPTVGGTPVATGPTGSASQQPTGGCTEAKAVDLADDEAAELEIEDFAYQPACATIAKGQALEIRNRDNFSHTFTVDALDITIRSTATPRSRWRTGARSRSWRWARTRSTARSIRR